MTLKKCPYWKEDTRKSGNKPDPDHPFSCIGCYYLKFDTHEGEWCGSSTYRAKMEQVPYPDHYEMEKLEKKEKKE